MYSDFTHRANAPQQGFDFVAAHFSCEADRYSNRNPNGFVNLGSAQNHLSKEAIANRLATLSHTVIDAEYQPFTGTSRCKAAIATHLERQGNTMVNPDAIVVGNGLVSLLESLGVAILNRGDRVLVPTPVFPGLVKALSARIRSDIVFLDTEMKDAFRVTPEIVAEAVKRSQQEHRPVKAILLCSPGNPVGHVYSREELHTFVRIAEEANCALIVDEVYALSCFQGASFESAVHFQSDHVFVMGGLSKDFGVAGYTVGWLHSVNAKIMKSVGSQAHFFRLATPAQRATVHLLEGGWYEQYVTRQRSKLTKQFVRTSEVLLELGISILPASAGLCAVLDLRSFLRRNDSASELDLYRHFLDHHRVHLSPSVAFHLEHPGFFRICFTTDEATLEEGLRRIRTGLESFSDPVSAPHAKLSLSGTD